MENLDGDALARLRAAGGSLGGSLGVVLIGSDPSSCTIAGAGNRARGDRTEGRGSANRRPDNLGGTGPTELRCECPVIPSACRLLLLRGRHRTATARIRIDCFACSCRGSS